MRTSNKVLLIIFCSVVAVVIIFGYIHKRERIFFFGWHNVIGNKEIISKTADLPNIKSLEVLGSAHVIVKHALKPQLVVRSDANILPFIKFRVMGNHLSVYQKENVSLEPTHNIVITLYTPDVNGDSFTLRINGSGNCRLSGKVNNLQLLINGSGYIMAKDLLAKNVTLNVNGSGNALVYATNKLTVAIKGSGKVQYYGKPTQIVKSISGSGVIESLRNT